MHLDCVSAIVPSVDVFVGHNHRMFLIEWNMERHTNFSSHTLGVNVIESDVE